MGGRGASSSLSSITSIDKLLKETAVINPNYSTRKKEYINNCQSCVLAFILREKGEDVVALGRIGQDWKDGNGKQIQLTKMFNNNPETNYYIVGNRRFDNELLARRYLMDSKYSNMYKSKATRNSIFSNDSDFIERQVKSWGNNASGYVRVQWKGSKGGHVFNIKNVNGKVVAIDTQSNKIRDLKKTLSQAKPQYTYFTRTDNLSINKNLKKYMVKER